MSVDPVANMISGIKNAYRARAKTMEIPYSGFKKAIACVLVAEGFLKEVRQDKEKKKLTLVLKYEGKIPAVSEILQISKPGLRHFVKADSLKPVLGGLGKLIISTPLGVMTDREARKKHSGGEIICEIW